MSETGAPDAARWLAAAAPDAGTCLAEWGRNPLGVTLLPAGRLWDVLIMPGELGGRTYEVLRLYMRPVGPVLGDLSASRIGFFVPPGTAAGWMATGVRGAGRGSWVLVPYPGRAAGGVRWICPPDGSGTLIDPVALELAMHEAAAGHEPAPEQGG
ncbi:hypothetical protein OYE22_07565 [Streptomyces sp. 71268]|uniref:hypothetical protein n=1 Tax=Streptomyces sp. 71268 TaxID=3002640 RepID=UPI0023F76119|nr:hypothetical protein [Streptomyces sp. 71268]WEV25069.1 hypothetical protein OYE22_07565 [Streptomyces sp. 71268]